MDDYISPDYNNIGLVTIDVQNDTLPGAPLEVKGTQEIIPAIIQLSRLFRDQNKLIIHIVRLYDKHGFNVDISRKRKIENGMRALIQGSWGAELADWLLPPDKRLDTEKLLFGEIQKWLPTNSSCTNRGGELSIEHRWSAFCGPGA